MKQTFLLTLILISCFTSSLFATKFKIISFKESFGYMVDRINKFKDIEFGFSLNQGVFIT